MASRAIIAQRLRTIPNDTIDEYSEYESTENGFNEVSSSISSPQAGGPEQDSFWLSLDEFREEACVHALKKRHENEIIPCLINDKINQDDELEEFDPDELYCCGLSGNGSAYLTSRELYVVLMQEIVTLKQEMIEGREAPSQKPKVIRGRQSFLDGSRWF